jgi:hypothetical protein
MPINNNFQRHWLMGTCDRFWSSDGRVPIDYSKIGLLRPVGLFGNSKRTLGTVTHCRSRPKAGVKAVSVFSAFVEVDD